MENVLLRVAIEFALFSIAIFYSGYHQKKLRDMNYNENFVDLNLRLFFGKRSKQETYHIYRLVLGAFSACILVFIKIILINFEGK